ncbi:MAG: 50S ribosomal protein L28 [Chloroflexi bacterium]|nr:50S ribosomal protein L28 [Chloroflexota bacterium]
MAKCDMCGKAPVAGNRVSKSMRHTKRRFQPNVHRKVLMIDGTRQRIYICTKCLKAQSKIA